MRGHNIIRLRTNGRKELLCYVAGSILAILYCFWALNLWNYDFNVPFWYRDGDTLFSAMALKRWIDGYFSTESLGAPFGSLLIDFPIFGDTLNIATRVFLLLLNGGNVGISINLFYIFLFPATFCSSFYVMRKLDITKWIAFLCAMLYTALPYRILRNTTHLDLANFTYIPFCVYICTLIYSQKTGSKLTKSCLIQLGIMLIPMAWSGIYYAFFACFFIGLTFLLKFLKDKTISKIAVGSFLGIVGLIALAMIPYLYQYSIYGSNPESPIRSSLEAEVYGLKITQFFIPNQSHGIPLLDKLLKTYSTAPLPNEGSEYLGIIGAVGLLLSLFTILGFQKENWRLQLLGKLNLGAILLGTIGGFGSIFALLISPQIRAYNRISVFVAFFSLTTFAILADGLLKKIKWKQVFMIAVALICAVTLIEQTIFQDNTLMECAQSYYSDAAFVEQIENYASEGAMIYQYPYHTFPETPPKNNMGDYALARGYMHSDTLKWSYGDYKGRSSDSWHRNLADKPIAQQIEIMTVVGFEGIYIDTYAYTQEQLSQLTTEIEAVIGTGDVCFGSVDERLLFYGLHNYQKQLQETYSQQELEHMKAQYLMTIQFQGGFYGLEENEMGNWRWCQQTGTLYLNNISDHEMELTLYATAATGYAEESKLLISHNDTERQYTITSSEIEIEYTCTLVPGKNYIQFSTNAPQVNAPGDSRELYFRLVNTKIELH